MSWITQRIEIQPGQNFESTLLRALQQCPTAHSVIISEISIATSLVQKEWFDGVQTLTRDELWDFMDRSDGEIKVPLNKNIQLELRILLLHIPIILRPDLFDHPSDDLRLDGNSFLLDVSRIRG